MDKKAFMKHAGNAAVIAIGVMVGLFIHSYAQRRMTEKGYSRPAMTAPVYEEEIEEEA